MMEIKVSQEIKNVCPEFVVFAIKAQVENSKFNAGLWSEIAELEEQIRKEMKLEQIKNIPTIYATRQTYKKLGKDPNRYRPSSESLHRRIHRGLPLYQINTLVDLINLVSIKSGYSIGGFDADKIEGNLELGVGRAGEIYNGIGRGELNIEGLPVYRDSLGGIGTPTSDEERTKIDDDTTSLLILINAYSGIQGLEEVGGWAIQLLNNYVAAKNSHFEMIGSTGNTLFK